jgi:hypothetical protein
LYGAKFGRDRKGGQPDQQVPDRVRLLQRWQQVGQQDLGAHQLAEQPVHRRAVHLGVRGGDGPVQLGPRQRLGGVIQHGADRRGVTDRLLPPGRALLGAGHREVREHQPVAAHLAQVVGGHPQPA